MKPTFRRLIKIVLLKPINIANLIYNFFLFKYFNVDYLDFPLIKGKLFLRNAGKFKIGRNVKINSSLSANPIGGDMKTVLIIGPNGKLLIEDGVGISNSAIYCTESITIEENVYIGGSCRIYDTNFHSLILEKRISINDDDIRVAPVCIKKGAFIGAGTIILKGVTVGIASIVAAGSVVVKDIPNYEVWGGNPARFLRKINPTN